MNAPRNRHNGERGYFNRKQKRQQLPAQPPPTDDPQPTAAEDHGHFKLWVCNLPADYSHQDVMDIFHAFHPICCDRPQKKSSMAFVTLASKQDAENAIASLNTSLLHTGKRLIVKPSDQNDQDKVSQEDRDKGEREREVFTNLQYAPPRVGDEGQSPGIEACLSSSPPIAAAAAEKTTQQATKGSGTEVNNHETDFTPPATAAHQEITPSGPTRGKQEPPPSSAAASLAPVATVALHHPQTINITPLISELRLWGKFKIEERCDVHPTLACVLLHFDDVNMAVRIRDHCLTKHYVSANSTSSLPIEVFLYIRGKQPTSAEDSVYSAPCSEHGTARGRVPTPSTVPAAAAANNGTGTAEGLIPAHHRSSASPERFPLSPEAFSGTTGCGIFGADITCIEDLAQEMMMMGDGGTDGDALAACTAQSLVTVFVTREHMRRYCIHAETLLLTTPPAPIPIFTNAGTTSPGATPSPPPLPPPRPSVLTGALVRVLINGTYTLRFIQSTFLERKRLFLKLDGIDLPVYAENISNKNPLAAAAVAAAASTAAGHDISPQHVEIQELAARMAFAGKNMLKISALGETAWRLRAAEAFITTSVVRVQPSRPLRARQLAKLRGQLRTAMSSSHGIKISTKAIDTNPISSENPMNKMREQAAMGQWHRQLQGIPPPSMSTPMATAYSQHQHQPMETPSPPPQYYTPYAQPHQAGGGENVYLTPPDAAAAGSAAPRCGGGGPQGGDTPFPFPQSSHATTGYPHYYHCGSNEDASGVPPAATRPSPDPRGLCDITNAASGGGISQLTGGWGVGLEKSASPEDQHQQQRQQQHVSVAEKQKIWVEGQEVPSLAALLMTANTSTAGKANAAQSDN